MMGARATDRNCLNCGNANTDGTIVECRRKVSDPEELAYPEIVISLDREFAAGFKCGRWAACETRSG